MTAADVDYSHTHMPLLRKVWRDRTFRRRSIADLAELDLNEEIDRSAVVDFLPVLASHLTAEERDREYAELKYLLEREAVAWADGSGQPEDMDVTGWRIELSRRIAEVLDTLAGGAP